METKTRDRVALLIIAILTPIIIGWGYMMLKTHGH
jgi:hypothetical protein